MLYPYFSDVTLNAYNRMVSELVRRASTRLGIPADQVVVRSLRPQDLGLATAAFTFNITSNTWNTIINTAVADNTFVGINGISISAAGVSQIRVTAGAAMRSIWNIQAIPGFISGTAWADDYVIADQNTPIVVDAYGTANNASYYLSIIGAVAESPGLVVAGPSPALAPEPVVAAPAVAGAPQIPWLPIIVLLVVGGGITYFYFKR